MKSTVLLKMQNKYAVVKNTHAVAEISLYYFKKYFNCTYQGEKYHIKILEIEEILTVFIITLNYLYAEN